MALVHSPNITTRNLVLNYDFANIKSYTGTGTNLVSSIPGVTAGTLTNGPIFKTTNAGIMSFDGTDDYATFDIGSGNLTEPMSVEMWCYIKNDESKALWSWGGAYMLWLYFNRIGYNTANSDSWGFFYDTSAMINKWAHFVFEMRSNVSTTNNKIYWNGVSQTLSWVFGSADASALRSFENGKGAFACRLDFGTPNLFTPVDVGVFRIYRGALTEEEVTRNYNALRGRYGV